MHQSNPLPYDAVALYLLSLIDWHVIQCLLPDSVCTHSGPVLIQPGNKRPSYQTKCINTVSFYLGCCQLMRGGHLRRLWSATAPIALSLLCFSLITHRLSKWLSFMGRWKWNFSWEIQWEMCVCEKFATANSTNTVYMTLLRKRYGVKRDIVF